VWPCLGSDWPNSATIGFFFNIYLHS
jgi:hypothetical protein